MMTQQWTGSEQWQKVWSESMFEECKIKASYPKQYTIDYVPSLFKVK